jgi:hypothetical protein
MEKAGEWWYRGFHKIVNPMHVRKDVSQDRLFLGELPELGRGENVELL